VTVHNVAADGVVGRLFQPSLSPSNHDESSRGRTSAFMLQPLSQTRIMIRFGSHLFTGIEGSAIIQLGGDRQIALPYIHADHALLGSGVGSAASSSSVTSR